MKRRDARAQSTAHRSERPVARRVGAIAAGLLVVAGTTTLFDASSTVLGSAPPSETLSCNDNWVGGASGDWDSAANWSTGVPNGTDVSACITGNASVTLTDVSSSFGALTVTAGSSLTIGAATSTATVVTIATLATRAWKGGLLRSLIRGSDIVNVRGFTAPSSNYTCPFLTFRFRRCVSG